MKYCYEQELPRQPDLVGKIDVQFTIAASGQVSAAAVQRSTIGNARVESCTVAAVRRWQFPPPFNGGTVIITYPFVLTPAHATTLVAGTNGAGAVEIEAIHSTLPTLFVHRSTDANAVPSNGLVAVTERGLLLVDTAWTDAQTEAVLAWGDGRFHRPWIGAVITHDHADRAGGIARARAPAHPGCGAGPDGRQARPARRARRDDAVPRARRRLQGPARLRGLLPGAGARVRQHRASLSGAGVRRLPREVDGRRTTSVSPATPISRPGPPRSATFAPVTPTR